MSVNTELLKNRDFRNTLFAIGANQLSDSMSYITTPIIILALTGSPEAASITLLSRVFSLPAPERYPERGLTESVPQSAWHCPVLARRCPGWRFFSTSFSMSPIFTFW